MSTLTLRTRRDGERAIVALSGELDLATVGQLRSTAFAELDAAAVLVLDLAELSFVDSTGLGCWIEIRNRAESAGKTLLLEELPASARRTLAVAGLAPLFGLDA